MPFDFNQTSTKWRLERLLHHLDQATDAEQWKWCSCLTHRCLEDELLKEAGLPASFIPKSGRHWTVGEVEQFNQWLAFFGFDPTVRILIEGAAVDLWQPRDFAVFGSESVVYKRRLIRDKLEELQHAV